MSDSFSLNFPDNSQTTGDKGDKELQDFLMIEKQKAQLNAQVGLFSDSFTLTWEPRGSFRSCVSKLCKFSKEKLS